MFFINSIGFQFGKAVEEYVYHPLNGVVIVIDAGHGGKDKGAQYDGVKESEVNLKIVKKCQELFENAGAKVVLTRSDEQDLADDFALNRKKSDMKKRIEIINRDQHDLFLSIHLNSYQDIDVFGAQVFYGDERLANAIQKKFGNSLKSEMEVKPGDFYLLNHARIPGVLIECGFLSNPKERSLLITENYQNQIAEMVFSGVLSYFKDLSYD